MLEFDSKGIRTWGHLGSCGAFGLGLCQAAKEDDSLLAITADLCNYSGLERFKGEFPDRLYNVGIAEQNMVGIAAGFVSEGFNAFASTYGTFASSRCLDQVRVSMGYMELPIKLVGVTSGFSSGILGPTHMSCEDLAVMNAIPNMTVLSPADTTETVKATIAAAAFDGPVYLRLSGIMGSPIVYKADYSYEIGKAITLRKGIDVLILATGPMVAESIKASAKLSEFGLEATIVDIHTLKPFDESVLSALGDSSYRVIVTAEEHSVIGGLGSIVASHLMEVGCTIPFLKIGVDDFFPHAASYKHLLDICGLSGNRIADRILKRLGVV